MPTRRRVTIERLDCVTSEQFVVRAARRSSPYIWFRDREVPAFKGPSDVFGIERVKGGGWKVRGS